MESHIRRLVGMLEQLVDPATEPERRVLVERELSEEMVMREPVELMEGLSMIGSGGGGYGLEIQLHSLVLLRSLALKPALSNPIWSTALTPTDQLRILQSLLEPLIDQHKVCHPNLASQLVHAFSSLANCAHPDTQAHPRLNLTPVLMATLLQAHHPHPHIQTAILNLFSNVPALFSPSQPQLDQIILASLASNHLPLRLAALTIISLPSTHQHPSLVDAVLNLLLIPLVNHPSLNLIQSDLEAALCHLIEFVAINHIPNLAIWIEPLLNLTLNRSCSSPVRASALESIISLLESSPPPQHSPRLPWLGHVFAGLLSLMAEIDDDQHWSTCLDNSDDDPNALYVQAEQALDRLSQEIAISHADQLFELILAAIQQPSSPSWQQAHAQLSALAVMGQSLAQSYQLSPEPIFHALNSAFNHPHPRVVYAAIYAISQLAEPLKLPSSAPPARHQVLLWLLRCLDSHSQPRLQAFASKALINVLSPPPAQTLVQDDMAAAILSRLVALCDARHHPGPVSDNLRLDAINAIGRLSGSVSRNAALAHYDLIIKCFESLVDQLAVARQSLANGSTDVDEEVLDETELRVFEAVGQLAVASGEQRFNVDSTKWASQMAGAIRTRPKGLARMVGSLTRLSAAMSAERFVQEGYLDLLLGQLLHGCRAKPDISISALLDDEHEFDEAQWESVIIGEQTFGIKATELSEKEQSIECLVVLAEQIGRWLIPHCDRIVEAVMPLLKFYFSDAVREGAMVLLPVLLRSAKSSGMPSAQLEPISTCFCQSLTLALSAEPMDQGNLAASLMTAWAECIRYQAPAGSEVDRMAEVCEARLEQVVGQGEEEEEEEESLMRMLTSMSRVLRLAIGLRPDWGWRRLMDRVVDWLGSCADAQAGIPLGLKRLGFRLVGAFVKSHAGGGGQELVAKVGSHILAGFKDKDDCVRGLAPFIVGLCAEKNGEEYQPVYMTLIQSSIEELVSGLKKKAEVTGEDCSVVGSGGGKMNVEAVQVARENCISALAKIIRNRVEGMVVEVEKILPEWIEALPIEIDVEEVEPSYGLLLELIARGHESVDPTKNSVERIGKVIGSLVSAISNEAIGVECRGSLSVGLGAYLREIPQQGLEVLKGCGGGGASGNGIGWEEVVWKEVERRSGNHG